MKPLELLGGESAYCISRNQLESARRLAFDDPKTSALIQEKMRGLEAELTRNERAALAFVLIDRLLQTSADAVQTPSE